MKKFWLTLAVHVVLLATIVTSAVPKKAASVKEPAKDPKQCNGRNGCTVVEKAKRVGVVYSGTTKRRRGIIKNYTTKAKTVPTPRTMRMIELNITLPKKYITSTLTTSTTTPKTSPMTTFPFTSTTTLTTTSTSTTTKTSTSSPTTSTTSTTTSTSTTTTTTTTTTSTTTPAPRFQCRWAREGTCAADQALSNEYNYNGGTGVGSKVILFTSGKKIFLSKGGTIRYGDELGIYEYCCALGMKVFEPNTLADFKDYYKLANASNVDEAQLGLIGETYVGSLGTLHYCSDNKLVPVEWPSTAPTGFGSFLAFSGMHANNIRPHLLRISDTVSTDKTPRTIQKADSQTGITYFACEPLVLMVTSGN